MLRKEVGYAVSFSEKAIPHRVRQLIQHLGVDEQTKLIAQNAWEKWRNGRLDPEPQLLAAGYFREESGHFVLVPLFSDEDFDLSGLGVSEIHRSADGREQVIEERCPIFETEHYEYRAEVWFDERTGDERLGVKAWDLYAEAKGTRLDESPAVWISLPKNRDRHLTQRVWVRGGQVNSCLLPRASYLRTTIRHLLVFHARFSWRRSHNHLVHICLRLSRQAANFTALSLLPRWTWPLTQTPSGCG